MRQAEGEAGTQIEGKKGQKCVNLVMNDPVWGHP